MADASHNILETIDDRYTDLICRMSEIKCIFYSHNHTWLPRLLELTQRLAMHEEASVLNSPSILKLARNAIWNIGKSEPGLCNCGLKLLSNMVIERKWASAPDEEVAENDELVLDLLKFIMDMDAWDTLGDIESNMLVCQILKKFVVYRAISPSDLQSECICTFMKKCMEYCTQRIDYADESIGQKMMLYMLQNLFSMVGDIAQYYPEEVVNTICEFSWPIMTSGIEPDRTERTYLTIMQTVFFTMTMLIEKIPALANDELASGNDGITARIAPSLWEDSDFMTRKQIAWLFITIMANRDEVTYEDIANSMTVLEFFTDLDYDKDVFPTYRDCLLRFSGMMNDAIACPEICDELQSIIATVVEQLRDTDCDEEDIRLLEAELEL